MDNRTKIHLSHSTTDICILRDQYIRYCITTLNYARGTLKHRRAFTAQLLIFLEDRDISDVRDITKYDIDDFLAGRAESISHGSLNDVKRSIRMFFLWVKDYKEISLQFKPNDDIKEKKLHRRRVKPVERTDIYRAIKKANQRQDRLLIATMYETGMRMEEVINLKIEDVKGEEVHVTGKGDKDRLVYVTPELSLELLMWFKMNGWTKGHVFRPLMHTDGDSGYESQETVRQRIKACFKAVGVDMHPHQLRHAFAVRLLKNGSNMRTIQKLLGHTNLETTMRYLNVTDPWLHQEYRYRFGKSAIK